MKPPSPQAGALQPGLVKLEKESFLMRNFSIALIIFFSILIVLAEGFYLMVKNTAPPRTITYTDITALERDIQRLEGLKKSGRLSWQDMYRLGVAYIQRGRMEDAAKILEEAEKLYPYFYKTYESLGMAYFRLGELNKAIEKWEKAMAMSDKTQHLGEIIDRARMKLEINKRIATLENVAKTGDIDWQTRFELALLLIATDKTEDARGHLEKILEEKKDVPDVYSAIAQSYAKDGDFEKAVEAQKKAVELNPDDEILRKRLSEMERVREGLKSGVFHKGR